MITTDDFVPGLDWGKRMAQRCGPWDVMYGPDQIFDEKLPTHPCIGGELVKHVGTLFLENKWFWSNAWFDIGHRTRHPQIFCRWMGKLGTQR